MFQIIDPFEHKSNKVLIDPFLKELRSYNPILLKSFQRLNKATFILAKENPDNIKGGAILLKKKVSTLYPAIKERLDSFIPPEQYIWTGTIHLLLHEDVRGHTFESLCKIFYRKLYEALIVFGIKEKTSFICLDLDPCEHLTTDLMGFWPYVVEVKHRESLDGIFHGILALVGTCNESATFWKSLSKCAKDLVA